MPTLRLQPLRLSEAEKLIAFVWQLLERENIASPRVTVQLTENSSAQISLIFISPGDAETLGEALQQLGHTFACDETAGQLTKPRVLAE